MEPLGMFIGFRYFWVLRKKKGDLINAGNWGWIIIGVKFGALIGSRLFGGLENIPAMLDAENKWIYFSGKKQSW